MTTSYRTLNQIFYKNNNKFDVPESIHLLEEFFYNESIYENQNKLDDSIIVVENEKIGIIETISHIDTVSNIKKIEDDTMNEKSNNLSKIQKENPLNSQKKMFVPFLTDTIFWCVFHHVYGEIEYAMIKSKHGNRMLEEKQKIMEHFQKTPKSLKQTNVKMTNDRIKETLSEFMCAKNCSSFLETAAYALYYDLTIYIIDEKNRTYLHFTKIDTDLPNNLCILYVDKNQNKKRYNLLTDTSAFDLPSLDSFVRLEHFDKPLKALTHYKKIAELEEIAQKLGIESQPKMKKQELYNLLAKKMAWV